ncbi:MAG: acylneuraminate cytidylyltransferase family protein [Deltaproteobacteria bacterium]|nr:acylneuraminate cytidylyltransferase family protein [Deltaproteobacteria bacterium]
MTFHGRDSRKIVSIIPARGKSKGIPRKNLVLLRGRPLIYYAIKASLDSQVEQTWVSSEDDEILRIAEDLGARALKRPEELSTDTASSDAVLLHFAERVWFDVLVFLQATSPLTTGEDIDRGISMLDEYDSVIAVSRLTQFVWTDGRPNYDIQDRKRRQEWKSTFLETGGFFITTRDNLWRYRNRIGGRLGVCVVPKIRSFDIDSYEDLEIVERLMA